MFVLLLSLTVFGGLVQLIAKKAYSKKIKGGAFIHSALSMFFSLIVFVIISGGKLNFVAQLIPYSVLFAILFSSAFIGSFLALSVGPISLTGLISSYSLLVPTIYGILFLNEPTSILLYIGIFLVAVSLFLVNREKKGSEKKISFKWGIFMLIAFVGNGGGSIVQKVQQLKFNGQYKNEFMVIALLISFVVVFLFALVFEKENLLKKITTGAHWYIINGVANGLVNLFVMMLAVWPASIVFPVISAGGILLTSSVGIFVYKEKMTAPQIVGIILGTVSIVLLNM